MSQQADPLKDQSAARLRLLKEAGSGIATPGAAVAAPRLSQSFGSVMGELYKEPGDELGAVHRLADKFQKQVDALSYTADGTTAAGVRLNNSAVLRGAGGGLYGKRARDSFMDMIIQQNLYNSIIDEMNQFDDPYDKFEYLRGKFFEITENFEKDEKGNIDWAKEARKAKLLDEETLARKENESDEEYQGRIRKTLEKKMLNPDGSLRTEYQDGPVGTAVWMQKKMQELSIEAHNSIKNRQHANAEELAAVELRTRLISQMQEELRRIRYLPAEEQESAIEKLFSDHDSELHSTKILNEKVEVTAENFESHLASVESADRKKSDAIVKDNVRLDSMMENVWTSYDSDSDKVNVASAPTAALKPERSMF